MKLSIFSLDQQIAKNFHNSLADRIHLTIFGCTAPQVLMVGHRWRDYPEYLVLICGLGIQEPRKKIVIITLSFTATIPEHLRDKILLTLMLVEKMILASSGFNFQIWAVFELTSSPTDR
jgi:hypothetical protein